MWAFFIPCLRFYDTLCHKTGHWGEEISLHPSLSAWGTSEVPHTWFLPSLDLKGPKFTQIYNNSHPDTSDRNMTQYFSVMKELKFQACIYTLSAEEFNKHSSVWMRVLKAAPLSRYKESFVLQINTSNVPFCCIKVWKVRAPLPAGMAECTGGTGAAGNLSVPGHCLTDPVKRCSHWMGWAFSPQPSQLECTPTKRLFSTRNHFIRSLSGHLRAGS